MSEMSTARLSLRLLGTHVIIAIMFVFAWPLMELFQKNEFLQWLICIFFIGAYALAMYSDLSNIGLKDVKRNTYVPYKGFAAGLMVSTVTVVLVILALAFKLKQGDGQDLISWSKVPEVILRIWLSPYVKVFRAFPDLMPALGLIDVIVFPLITGISYLFGPYQYKKVVDVIKKNNALREEKSKMNKD